jgi:cell division protein ZapA (FtsZ GTPase activity inhibitor)
VPLGSQVNIFCTDEQAKELLAIAEKDCTGAISAIKTGIRVGDEAI